MFVITENLVLRACIEIRQGRATPADLEDFCGEAACGLLSPNPLQAFFGGSAHGGRNRFSGSRGEFAYELFGRRVLDIERHGVALAEIICT
jgi:hypothetical protein